RVPEKITDAGLFGNAIHDSFNQYIIAHKKGKTSKKYLLEKFYESRYLLSITQSEVDRFIKRGEKALNGFYDERVVNWSNDIESELDIKGIRINDELYLNGKIDMIEILDKNFRSYVY